MSAAKEEQLNMRQLRYLQDKVSSCEKSIKQKKKNIKLNKAKCAAVEQDTKAIIEYLEFDLAKKQQRLLEMQELYEQQTQKSQLELEETDEKNNKILLKLEDKLKELTTNLTKTKANHANILDDQQKHVLLCNDKLVQNQKSHEDKIKEMREEALDPEMIASILQKNEADVESIVREEFFSLVRAERKYHQLWRDKLAILKEVAPRVRAQMENLVQKRLKDQQSLMDAEQDVEEATAENQALTQNFKRLQGVLKKLDGEVQDHKCSVEDHERNMKCDRLSQRIAKTSMTCQKKNKEIDSLHRAIEAERSRSTELSLALKEADIIFRHIIEEPKMDLQKLRQLFSILESYAPPQPTF